MSESKFVSLGASDALAAYLNSLVQSFTYSVTRIEVHLSGEGNYTPVAYAWGNIEGIPDLFPPAAHKHSWDEIENIPTQFTPKAHRHHWNEIDGKPAAFNPDHHHHAWGDIEGKPEAYTPVEHTHWWQDIEAKPSKFPPEAHKHGWNDIDGKPLAFPSEEHAHHFSEIEGLPSQFPPSPHFHGWEDVKGKPEYYPPTTHTHDLSTFEGVSALGMMVIGLRDLDAAQKLLAIPRVDAEDTVVSVYTADGRHGKVKMFTGVTKSGDGGRWSIDYSHVGFTEILGISAVGQMVGTDLASRVTVTLAADNPTLTGCAGRIMSASAAGLLAAMTATDGTGNVYVTVWGK